MTVKEYMDSIRNAAGTKLIESDGLYSGRVGNIRFAHEVGYALNDFNAKEQEEFLHSSYSNIYVRACFLKPMLDAGEWIKCLESQIKKEIGKEIYQIADELDFMQEQKNNGKGVSCVQTIIVYLDKGDFESACTVVRNEWDKICSYTDIAQYLIKNKLYTPYDFVGN